MKFLHTEQMKSTIQKKKYYDFKFSEEQIIKIKEATFEKPFIFETAPYVKYAYYDKKEKIIRIYMYISCEMFESEGLL